MRPEVSWVALPHVHKQWFRLWPMCQKQKEPWRALESGGCIVVGNTLVAQRWMGSRET